MRTYWRFSELVLLVELGPALDEQGEDLHVALGRRAMQRRIAVLVHLVDLRALRDQQLRDVAVSLAAGVVQRRSA
jgi:hypothetical protein